jgi:hypothetical protein
LPATSTWADVELNLADLAQQGTGATDSEGLTELVTFELFPEVGEGSFDLDNVRFQ